MEWNAGQGPGGEERVKGREGETMMGWEARHYSTTAGAPLLFYDSDTEIFDR